MAIFTLAVGIQKLDIEASGKIVAEIMARGGL
jgi:hypothetical protein